MRWNWEEEKWPNFIYNKEKLAEFEHAFFHKAGMLSGSLKHVGHEDQDILKVNLISDEAFKTSEIEGELLNRDSLQWSIRKHFGLKTDNRKISPAELGIAEMMMNLYKTYEQPLTHEQLFSWQK